MGNRVKKEDDSRAQINPETPGRDEMNMSRMPAYTSTNIFSPPPRHVVSENTPKERPNHAEDGWKSVRSLEKIRITKHLPCNLPRRAEPAGIYATTLGSEHVNGCNTQEREN